MKSRQVFWVALVVALAVTLGVHLLMFPGSVPDFVRASGGGTLLDATPAFSEEALYARLEAYGQNGRGNYRFRNLTVDILLPISVLPFLMLLSRRAVDRLGRRGLLAGVMLAAPFAYVTFDLVENAIVLALLQHYPQRLSLLAAVLPYATIVKRVASIVALLLPLTVLTFRRWIPIPKPHSMTS
jgi:hypothetical protein